MSRQRDTRARVLGPYWVELKQAWQVITLDPCQADRAKRKVNSYFRGRENAQAAEDFAELHRARLARLEGKTIGQALEDYEMYLTERGNKQPGETLRRLRLFLPTDVRVARITESDAEDLYTAFRAGKSVDYHRNTLAEVKTFYRFAVRQGLTVESPFEKVQGVGRRSAGKAQLTGDEARKFHAAALELADAGDLGALGADMLLLMGLRSSEVFLRRVRDLDLGGTVLRIPEAKTKRGRRVVAVPEVLRGRLLNLAKGCLATAYLFANPDGSRHMKTWLRKAVIRVCTYAEVPIVCPHGLRGTHATLAIEAGQGTQAVAAHLGHERVSTTTGHYATAESVDTARAGRALGVIQGGRR